MDADGTHLQRVTSEGNWYVVTWSPDGSKLLLGGDDGSNALFDLAVPDGPDLTPLPLPEWVTPAGLFSWWAPSS
jgi:Tol biopolymer transport system component